MALPLLTGNSSENSGESQSIYRSGEGEKLLLPRCLESADSKLNNSYGIDQQDLRCVRSLYYLLHVVQQYYNFNSIHEDDDDNRNERKRKEFL